MMQMLCNAPCNRDTIIGRSTATDLIQQDQAARSDIVDDRSRFIHLYHEGGFTTTQVVRCAYTCKYLIRKRNSCFCSRYKGPDMCHQRDQCCLPQQCTLTTHIRT